MDNYFMFMQHKNVVKCQLPKVYYMVLGSTQSIGVFLVLKDELEIQDIAHTLFEFDKCEHWMVTTIVDAVSFKPH
jgi:hypothetical protein